MSLSEYINQDNRFIEQGISTQSNDIYEARMNEFCMNYMNKPIDEPITINHGISRPKCSISPIDVSSVIDSSISNVTNDPEKIQNESYLTLSTNYNQFSVSPSLNKIDYSYNLRQNATNTAIPSISSIFYDSGFHQSYQDLSTNNSALLASTNSPYIPTISSKFRKLNERPSLSHLNPKQSIQFQSTPNKNINSIDNFIQSIPSTLNKQNINRTNFRNIDDLAKSSTRTSISVDSSTSKEAKEKDGDKFSCPLTLQNNNTIDNTNTKESQVANSNAQASNLTALSSSNIAFNEQLRILSQSLYQNKENSQEFLSKIKRKPRTQITKQQREILEYAYALKSYPDSNEVEYLCHVLGFEENVIRIWFQNKRARHKNRHM